MKRRVVEELHLGVNTKLGHPTPALELCGCMEFDLIAA